MITVEKYVEAAIDGNCYTPDLASLQLEWDLVPVFVYGCTKAKFSEADFIEEGVKVGVGRTVVPNYLLYLTTEHEPVGMFAPGHVKRRPLQGEVHLVTIDTLRRLDAYHQNTVFFNRVKQHVIYHKPEDVSLAIKKWAVSDAYFYVGAADYFQPKINKGAMRLMTPIRGEGGKELYFFSRADDRPNVDAINEIKGRACM